MPWRQINVLANQQPWKWRHGTAISLCWLPWGDSNGLSNRRILGPVSRLTVRHLMLVTSASPQHLHSNWQQHDIPTPGLFQNPLMPCLTVHLITTQGFQLKLLSLVSWYSSFFPFSSHSSQILPLHVMAKPDKQTWKSVFDICKKKNCVSVKHIHMDSGLKRTVLLNCWQLRTLLSNSGELTGHLSDYQTEPMLTCQFH